ncbi:hypothetical protein ACJ2A9_22315 [Anaerobacillus sp. MEB173]|uniref:hypothetical protein n=1 Tax=Anaerobacillus sp. MEB173 TaxID=3383345 RepID=UPI003F93AE78
MKTVINSYPSLSVILIVFIPITMLYLFPPLNSNAFTSFSGHGYNVENLTNRNIEVFNTGFFNVTIKEVLINDNIKPQAQNMVISDSEEIQSWMVSTDNDPTEDELSFVVERNKESLRNYIIENNKLVEPFETKMGGPKYYF